MGRFTREALRPEGAAASSLVGLDGRATENLPRASCAADVCEWSAAALPGDKLIYHSGGFLPRSEAVAEVRRLESIGEILFVQSRIAPGQVDYIAIKRRNAEARGLPAASPRTEYRGVDVETEEGAEALLAVLRRLANLGRTCPTNRELAELAILKDAESVRYRMGLLSAAGRIEVATPQQGARVVTICSSGRKTARSPDSGGR